MTRDKAAEPLAEALRTLAGQATFAHSDVRAFEDALSEFFAHQSPEHEEDCPEDDTCDCEELRGLNAAGPPMRKSLTRLYDATRAAVAALAAYEASAEQGTAWRREAPTEPGFYPWRSEGGTRTIVAELDADGDVYYPGCETPEDRESTGGEWGPRIDLGTVASPAAQVVEAARIDGMRIVRNALLREWMPMTPKYAACFVVEREMKRIDPNCDLSLPDDLRALTAGTPGKEP